MLLLVGRQDLSHKLKGGYEENMIVKRDSETSKSTAFFTEAQHHALYDG